MKRHTCRRCGRSYAFAQGLGRHKKREHTNEVHVDVTAPAPAGPHVDEVVTRLRTGRPAFDTVAASKAEALRRKHLLHTLRFHGRVQHDRLL